MPVFEETGPDGTIRRVFRATTTAERRRDREVRAALRRSGVRPEPDLYAAVLAQAGRGLTPDQLALVYQLAVVRRAAARAARAGPLTPAGLARKLGRAVDAVVGGDPLAALPPHPESDDGTPVAE